MAKMALLIVFGLSIPSGVTLFGQDGRLPEADEVLHRYKESLSWLQSVSMKVYVKMWQGEAGASGPYREEHFIQRRDGARTEWVGKSIVRDNHGNTEDTYSIKDIFGDKQYLTAYGPGDRPPIWAIITTDSKIYSEDELGFREDPPRGGPLNGRIFGNNHKSVAELLSVGNSADLHLRGDLESVNGIPCYVLESTTEYGKVTAWIVPEKGYNVLKWVIEKSPSDLFDAAQFSAMWPEIVSWKAMLHSVDLEKIGDVFVPVAAHFTHTIRKRNGQIINNHFEYKRSEIELNPDFDALGAFVFNLPNGTPVSIKEFPGIHYVWHNGKAVADVDQKFLDDLNLELEPLKIDVKAEPTRATEKKSEGVRDESQRIADTRPDITEPQEEVLSEYDTSLMPVLIPIGLLAIGVIVWLVFRRLKA